MARGVEADSCEAGDEAADHPPLPCSGTEAGESISLTLKLGRKVGEGTSGQVSVLKDAIDGGSYVVKRVPLKHADKSSLLHEVRIHREVSAGCSHVVRYAFSNMTAEDLIVGMEACDCVLWDLLAGEDGRLGPLSRGPPSLLERQYLSLAKEISEAVSHCHSLRIIHRDINPWNIFIVQTQGPDQPSFSAKLGDFGLSAKLPQNVEVLEGMEGNEDVPPLDGSALSSLYSAPELGHTYGLPADMFSLGMVFLVLWASSVAQQEDQLITYVEAAKVAAQKGRVADWNWFPRADSSSRLVNLISSLLQGDTRARPTAQSVVTTLRSIDQDTTSKDHADVRASVEDCFRRYIASDGQLPFGKLCSILERLDLDMGSHVEALRQGLCPVTLMQSPNEAQPQEPGEECVDIGLFLDWVYRGAS